MYRVAVGIGAFLLTGAAVLTPTENPPAVLSGAWQSINSFGLQDPPAGPGPIGDLDGYSHFGFGVDGAHRVTNSNPWIGNYRSRLLTPWAAEILRKKAETAIAGQDPFWAQSNCSAGGPAAVLWAGAHHFIQTKNVLYIVYERDHDVRRVYMNQAHTKNPSPSWYGESVGHYEGNTLVIDTIGFNDRTFVDRYGTPHSTGLHLVERYAVLPDGKTLEGILSFEDKEAYTTRWSAVVKYTRLTEPLSEEACAEAADNPITGNLFPVPTAQRPDF